MAQYLVTGAAGFIAHRVIEMLLEQGHRVIGVDNLNDAYDVRLKDWRMQNILQKLPGFTFVPGDITDLQGMERRKVLIDSLARELATAKGVSVESGGDDKEKNRISPHWKAPDPGLQNPVRQIPPWLFPGVCVALALLLFLIYNLILGSQADGVLEGLK